MVDGDDNEGSGHAYDNGRYGGWDGHHWMRKGRRHDNKTIHNNEIGKR